MRTLGKTKNKKKELLDPFLLKRRDAVFERISIAMPSVLCKMQLVK